jgi:hypothetical protein
MSYLVSYEIKSSYYLSFFLSIQKIKDMVPSKMLLYCVSGMLHLYLGVVIFKIGVELAQFSPLDLIL